MRAFVAVALSAVAVLCALSSRAEAQGSNPFQSNPATRPLPTAPGPLPAMRRVNRSVANRPAGSRTGGQLDPIAQQGQAGWTLDTEVGCNAWNVDPIPKESVKWDGQCHDGMVNGQGHLQWLGEDGSVLRDEEGQFVDGRTEGHTAVAWADGTRYNGEWQNGRPNGLGLGVMPDGKSYNGVWADGCFKDGDRRAAINRELTSCP
jgi:hypothetical protein